MLFNDTLFTNPGSRIIELHCLENVIQKLQWFTSESMPICHSPLPHLKLIMVFLCGCMDKAFAGYATGLG